MKINLPGLHGGISQQAAELRLQNQHTDAVNLTFDVIDGVKVRWPMVANLQTSPGTNKFLGSIKTTDGITWMIYHTRETLGAWQIILVPDDITVTPKSISGVSGDYLDTSSDNLKLYNILDTLLCLNTDKVTSLVSEQSDSQLGARPYGILYCPKIYVGNTVTMSVKVQTTITTTVIPTLKQISFFMDSYLATEGHTSANLYGTFDVMFNSMKNPHVYSGAYDDLLIISVKSAVVNHEGNAWQALKTTTNVKPGTDGTAWSVLGPQNTLYYPDWSSTETYYTLADLVAAGTTIVFSFPNKDYEVRGYDAIPAIPPVNPSDALRYVIRAKSFEELPPFLPGTLHSLLVFQLSEGYYVTFNISSRAYEESALPGHKYALNKLTMPHELRYTASTKTWTLSSVDAYETNGRLVGDSNSTPLPSFVGRKLNAVFFYRNRMCYLSENRIIMSRVGSYYNHFPETATEVIDSDPIDVFPAYKDYSPLLWAIPYSKNLVLIGPEKQYILHSGYEALSPKTVAIDEATSYKILPQMEPLLLESSILLWLDQGANAGLLEYNLNEQEIATEGALLTDNVPSLIPSDITNSHYLQSERMVFVYKQDADVVYVYKFHKAEGGQRMQSAWTKWDIPLKALTVANESTILIQGPTHRFTMDTSVDELAEFSMDIYQEVEDFTGSFTVESNYLLLDKTTGKLLGEPGDTVVIKEPTHVVYGKPIVWYLELSPLVLRDHNGLPRADLKSTIKNIQVDWSGGSFDIEMSGDHLPTRVFHSVPTSYQMDTVLPGKSLPMFQPTRALVMAPTNRTRIKIKSAGYHHVKLHNLVYNLEVRKDKG